MGALRAGYDESQKRNGITRETWSFQETPDGNPFVLVWFECPDPEAVFAVSPQTSPSSRPGSEATSKKSPAST